MQSDTIDRVRKVDVEKLEVSQADELADQISQEINKMVDEVCIKANKMLNAYGLETKMQIVIQKKNEEV